MALTPDDIEEIKKKYLYGRNSEHIAKCYGVSGQYIRKLIKDNDWKELRVKEVRKDRNRNRETASTARDLALLEAKSADNFRRDTPVVREFILDELAKGVSVAAACRSVGIDPATLRYWRQKDEAFDLRCHEAQSDFISGLERLACGVSTPKDALNLLSRHPLTKDQWTPQNEKGGGIVVNLNFDRNSLAQIGQVPIEGECKVIED